MKSDIYSSRPMNSGGLAVVLGGSGFVGSRLAHALTDQGIRFRVADLQPSKDFPGQWAASDVRRKQSVLEALSEAEVIINLAAAHRDDIRPLSLYKEVNVQGAENVCLAARESNVKKIIFTSSVAVYGFQPKPVDENGPFEPFNEYGRTKLEAEAVYRAWADEDPSRTLVIVRPTVVFGEGNRGNVYNLLHQIASGRFVMVGSGKNIKSMAYVGNVAAFLAHTLTFGPGIHIFNYVDGPDMETRTLVEFICGCLGQNCSRLKVPMAAALAGGYLFDAVARMTGSNFPISAIRVRKFCENTQVLADRIAETGFVPPHSLSDGLARTIRFEFPHGESHPEEAMEIASK